MWELGRVYWLVSYEEKFFCYNITLNMSNESGYESYYYEEFHEKKRLCF